MLMGEDKRGADGRRHRIIRPAHGAPDDFVEQQVIHGVFAGEVHLNLPAPSQIRERGNAPLTARAAAPLLALRRNRSQRPMQVNLIVCALISNSIKSTLR